VDPLAREDGAPDADPALGADAASDEAQRGALPLASNAGEQDQQPHPVRSRLVARAAAAKQDADAGGGPVRGTLEEIGRADIPDEFDLELGDGSATRAPSAPLPVRGRSQLSPTLIAVFGTLMGVATVVSIIALMINLDQRHMVAAPKPTLAPSASAAAVAVPEPPPPSVSKRPRQKLPGPWRIADGKGDPHLRFVEAKIGTDPFIKALTNTNVDAREAYRVIASLKGIRDLDKCGKQDHFLALIDRATSRIRAFEYIAGPEEIYQAREGSDGLLKGTKLDLKVERGQVMGALVYDGQSFDASAKRAGFDPGLGHAVAKALEGHVAMDELERGDVLRVIAQEVTVLGEFARYSGVEALELRRADAKTEPTRIYYFDSPKLRGYYDNLGKSPYEGGWRKPIKDAPITSPFNLKRFHPILKRVVPHLGTDIGAPVGTPVGAASFGTVSFIGPGGPSGNLIKVKHPNGIETGYAHLSRYAEGIKVGDKVKRLQIVGYVGNTGRSTGPHLHFSAERDGKFFDAETLNLDGMRTLNKDERADFALVTTKYDALLETIPLPEALPAPAPSFPSLSASGAPAGVASNALLPGAPPSVKTPDPSFAEPNLGDSPDEPAATAGSAAPNASAAKPTPAAAGSAHAVFLSDKELLKLQSGSDDGEVEE
jgi:Peptidase family M23